MASTDTEIVPVPDETPADDAPPVKKAASVAGSRHSVKSEKLVEAFTVEMEVMDQEVRMAKMKAEHEHAVQMQEAELKLKQLRLKKELAERIAQLEDDVSSSEPEKVEIALPNESDNESVRRYFESQQCNIPDLPTTPQLLAQPTNMLGIEKMAASISQMANAIMLQNATIQKVAISSQLPKLTVPVFSGDPLTYPLWKNAFSSLVDSKPLDGAMKLNYLNSYVSGEPKKIVEHYLLLGTDDAYLRARELLARRYGSSSVVSSSFCRKLNAWPRISDRDPAGLQTFADFLEQVLAAKATVESLGVLDFPQENIKLLEKLPMYLERQWRDEVIRWQSRGYGSYPPFSTFVDFVRRAANKANLPELAGLQRSDGKPRQPQYTYQGNSSGHPSKGRTLATTASQYNQKGKYTSCPWCDGKHGLDDCEQFMKKSLPERKSFFFQKRLCMGCGADDRHRAKECSSRGTCKLCKGGHLTSLHRPNETPPKEEASSKCTNVCSLPDQDGKDHALIVPVWVRRADEPSREFLQYAILDDQSNVGFISSDLCHKMALTGPETNLKLTTMQATAVIKSQKVSGVQVLDFNREQVIDLPALYTRDVVPASRSQIPKGEVVKQWPHLEPMAQKMMPYNENMEVSLLIGNNCSRAIRPREVIAGGEDDPYAVRTALGWGVVGRVCQTPTETEDAVCHRLQASNEYPHLVHPCGEKAANFIRSDFYVDDGLKSESDVTSAVKLLENSQGICVKAGLRLHKIIPNSRAVLESFPKEDRATDTESMDFDRDALPLERILGVTLCISSDIFKFKIELKRRPFTRRVLSTVSSIYDLCGFLSPVMLKGKQILQELCRRKLDWDSPMPDDLKLRWETWLRWRKEYLQVLQSRQKWNGSVKDLQTGDIVISKENNADRYQWPMARVIDIYPSADGRVRKVNLLMADGTLDHHGRRTSPPSELERPVHKLVLILPASK